MYMWWGDTCHVLLYVCKYLFVYTLPIILLSVSDVPPGRYIIIRPMTGGGGGGGGGHEK